MYIFVIFTTEFFFEIPNDSMIPVWVINGQENSGFQYNANVSANATGQ
mgnify:CR=1 FL=1